MRALESCSYASYIYIMRPNSSNLSFKFRGGRVINVTGQNLNVVQHPKMSVSYEPRESFEGRRRRSTHVSVRSPLVMVKVISHIASTNFTYQTQNSFSVFMQTGLIHLIHSQRFKYVFRGGLIIYLTKFELVKACERKCSQKSCSAYFSLSSESEFVCQCYLGANDLQEPRGAIEIQDCASVVRDGQCAHRFSHHQEQAVHVPPKPRLIPAQQ